MSEVREVSKKKQEQTKKDIFSHIFAKSGSIAAKEEEGVSLAEIWDRFFPRCQRRHRSLHQLAYQQRHEHDQGRDDQEGCYPAGRIVAR